MVRGGREMAVKFPKLNEDETRGAIMSPQVGDRFTEMFAYWLYVLEVNQDTISVLEANPPCTLPGDGKLREMTRAEFVSWLSCGSIPGYWVKLAGRGCNVAGWLERVRRS